VTMSVPVQPAAALDDCVDPGDTAWVAFSTVLVLIMMPALALFEVGLLRARSTVSILTQVSCFTASVRMQQLGSILFGWLCCWFGARCR